MRKKKYTKISDFIVKDIENVKKRYTNEPPPFLIAGDMVNHPPHYTAGGIECIDALEASMVNKTGIEAHCVGNIIKYLWRYENKNGLEDVKKAEWYLKRLIQTLENKKC